MQKTARRFLSGRHECDAFNNDTTAKRVCHQRFRARNFVLFTLGIIIVD